MEKWELIFNMLLVCCECPVLVFGFVWLPRSRLGQTYEIWTDLDAPALRHKIHNLVKCHAAVALRYGIGIVCR